jgi:cytidine deaminase
MTPTVPDDVSEPGQPVISTLLEAATQAIESIPLSDNHSVGSAALSADGRVFAGVNVYHFTGGPCAEVVVIGAAAGAGVTELTHIVAVGNKRRGVVPPCGRCRQILMEYYPNIKVVVRDASGAEVLMELARLLPFSYVWKDDD